MAVLILALASRLFVSPNVHRVLSTSLSRSFVVVPFHCDRKRRVNQPPQSNRRTNDEDVSPRSFRQILKLLHERLVFSLPKWTAHPRKRASVASFACGFLQSLLCKSKTSTEFPASTENQPPQFIDVVQVLFSVDVFALRRRCLLGFVVLFNHFNPTPFVVWSYWLLDVLLHRFQSVCRLGYFGQIDNLHKQETDRHREHAAATTIFCQSGQA